MEGWSSGGMEGGGIEWWRYGGMYIWRGKEGGGMACRGAINFF